MMRIDWTNEAAVIAYAKRMGPGMVVIQRPGRRNFNITHASRPDRLVDARIVFAT